MIKKKTGIVSNTIYAFILQASSIAFALVLSPYTSRVLGAENLGKINFSSSVAEWFALFAVFGTLVYGVREVANRRNDREALSKYFSEIFVIRLICTLIASAVYFPVIFIFKSFSREWVVFLIQGVVIIFSVLSFDWFFQGMEDFKYIAVRSLIFKVISIVCVFLMVKKQNDYIIYAIISVVSTIIPCIISLFYLLRKYVKLSFRHLNIKQHIKPLAVFFAGILISSVYNRLDLVALGLVKGDYDVALYSRSKMMMHIGITLVMAFCNAVIPRIVATLEKSKKDGDETNYKSQISLIMNVVLGVGLPIVIGIMLYSYDVMLLLGGSEFRAAGASLMILCPLIIILPLSNVNTNLRIITRNKEAFVVVNNCFVALAFIVSAIIFMPRWGFVGAASAYAIAEAVGLLMNLIYSKKLDKINIFRIEHIKYIVSAILMTAVVLLIKYLIPNYIIALLVGAASGAIIYVLINAALRTELYRIAQKYIFKKTVKINEAE